MEVGVERRESVERHVAREWLEHGPDRDRRMAGQDVIQIGDDRGVEVWAGEVLEEGEQKCLGTVKTGDLDQSSHKRCQISARSGVERSGGSGRDSNWRRQTRGGRAGRSARRRKTGVPAETSLFPEYVLDMYLRVNLTVNYRCVR